MKLIMINFIPTNITYILECLIFFLMYAIINCFPVNSIPNYANNISAFLSYYVSKIILLCSPRGPIFISIMSKEELF